MIDAVLLKPLPVRRFEEEERLVRVGPAVFIVPESRPSARRDPAGQHDGEPEQKQERRDDRRPPPQPLVSTRRKQNQVISLSAARQQFLFRALELASLSRAAKQVHAQLPADRPASFISQPRF